MKTVSYLLISYRELWHLHPYCPTQSHKVILFSTLMPQIQGWERSYLKSKMAQKVLSAITVKPLVRQNTVTAGAMIQMYTLRW